MNRAFYEEGQTVLLADGRCFRFIWAGSITEAKDSIFAQYAHHTVSTNLRCRRCDRKFAIGESYYKRRSSNVIRKPRDYCLPCASLVGLIEGCSAPRVGALEVVTAPDGASTKTQT